MRLGFAHLHLFEQAVPAQKAASVLSPAPHTGGHVTSVYAPAHMQLGFAHLPPF
jgi:hypothetical protein